jgi:D-methionine transport system ATP-binding protein
LSIKEAIPIIEIKSLSKTFYTKDHQVTALQDIDLTINKGDIYGIIGMSGAGKSTLVRCINYLEKPTKGYIAFNGQNLSSLDNRQLRATRRSISMIFQQFNLLMQRTVQDNVTFPLEISGINKLESQKRATELLNLVGLSEKAKAYPSQLSGGQKQRVAIARALATNPKVLLCDEATSALDPTTTSSILSLLKDINQRLGITIIIITHEMSVIEEICSHVAILDNSQVAESGTVEDIFTKPQTSAAQRLVYPNGKKVDHFIGTRCCRIVFDGNSSFEPVVANMVLECKEPVNILFADTKNIDGKAFGQIVIQLPENPAVANRMISYLNSRNLTVEEVSDYVG